MHTDGTEYRTETRRHLTRWVALFELLMAFGLADAGIVSWSAKVISGPELAACTTAYLLVACGALVTAWHLE